MTASGSSAPSGRPEAPRHAGAGGSGGSPPGGYSGGSSPRANTVVVIGAHILDVLGRPVESIPAGQGSARLTEIKATAAGTAAGLPEVIAAANGALVAVDVLGPGSPRTFDRIRPLLSSTDWFMPNGDQLLALTGQPDHFSAIKEIVSLGTGGVAVTLGADGCLVATRDADPVHLPALPTHVVDTTGCGDAFNAGMIIGLLLSRDPIDAARLGLACGALVATGLGSDAGIVDLDQVLGFLRSAKETPG